MNNAQTQEGSLAQEGSPEQRQPVVHFKIASQPLAVALQAYSRTSSVEVLYESSIVAEIQSPAVDGEFTPDAALRLLLSGTDIVARHVRRDAITLTRPGDDRDLPPAHPLASADLSLGTLRVTASAERADDGRLRAYSEAVQADIEYALRRHARTRLGNYRVGVKLWVDTTRTIRKTELSPPTNDNDRDVAISGILQGLVLSRPAPANTPQPIRVVIVVRSL